MKTRMRLGAEGERNIVEQFGKDSKYVALELQAV